MPNGAAAFPSSRRLSLSLLPCLRARFAPCAAHDGAAAAPTGRASSKARWTRLARVEHPQQTLCPSSIRREAPCAARAHFSPPPAPINAELKLTRRQPPPAIPAPHLHPQELPRAPLKLPSPQALQLNVELLLLFNTRTSIDNARPFRRRCTARMRPLALSTHVLRLDTSCRHAECCSALAQE